MIENIKQNFNAIAVDYNKQRRALIPCFDDFYKCITDCLSFSAKNKTILDLGAGTGLLTEMILKKFPKSEFTLLDVSDEMLEQAKLRFSGNYNVKYLIGDYSKTIFDEKYDAVISALSIHHLEDNDKHLLFRNIYNSLNHGGIFINGDQFRSKHPEIESWIINSWKQKIETSNLNRTDIDAAYQRMKLDKPSTVHENLEWMEDAGFQDVELMYKYYPFGVIVGFKK